MIHHEKLAFIVLFLLVGGACAARQPPQQEEPPPPTPPQVTLHDPGPPSAPGSLWDEEKARVLIGMDGIAHRVGDFITVRIEESAQTESSADTSTSRESENAAGITSLFGIEKSILKANSNMGAEIGMGAASSSSFDGEGSTSRKGVLIATLTCKVVDVLPNGNLVIWGWKQVRSNRETQYLVLTGQVRPRDIQIDNTVQSSLLAEARIEYTGSGVISDKQGPGIGSRIMDWVWPF